MSELKATEGEWNIRTGVNYCCIRTGSMHDRSGKVIADMRIVGGYYNPFDANLISASKDLYYSNQELAEHVIELCEIFGVPLPQASLDRHREASKKARGES